MNKTKNEKILDMIPKLRKLNDQKLDLVDDYINASLKVQFLMSLSSNKSTSEIQMDRKI